MENIRFLWPNGLKKALTFSYDDGVVQDRRLIKIMRKNGNHIMTVRTFRPSMF